MRVGLIQLCSGDDPAINLRQTSRFVDQAVSEGAGFVLTPEVTNCVSGSRARQAHVLQDQENDQTLAALRDQAARLGVWVLIGSLALKTNDSDERFANRSFLIAPSGEIAAQYDKIHMFDVQVSPTETYHESKGYRPGNKAVIAETPFATLGLTICYDVRFPRLFRDLAQAGAEVLTVPAAFSTATGPGHWEVLLRARAIETGSYILAPAQCGTHPTSTEKTRRSHGHSLAIDPWGNVLVDGGTEPGVSFITLQRGTVSDVRRKLPSLSSDSPYLFKA